VATSTVRARPKAVVLHKPGRPRMVVYVFGRYIRIAHWVRNGLLIWLVMSGIYIGNPFLARNLASEASESSSWRRCAAGTSSPAGSCWR
jgi:Ni,Fe-hydrogenase I cytochrome b subunit